MNILRAVQLVVNLDVVPAVLRLQYRHRNIVNKDFGAVEVEHMNGGLAARSCGSVSVEGLAAPRNPQRPRDAAIGRVSL